MLSNAEQMEPYERQLLLVAYQQLMSSPMLNVTQKTCIERKMQEIVDICLKKDFV